MNLNEIREKIDRIDKRIIELIHSRMKLMPMAAEIKLTHNLKIRQPEREDTLLKERKKNARAIGINETMVEEVFRLLIEESCNLQEKTIGERK